MNTLTSLSLGGVRLRLLGTPIGGVLVAIGYAWGMGTPVPPILAALLLVGVALMALGESVLNDANDYISGVDQHESLRPGHLVAAGHRPHVLKVAAAMFLILGTTTLVLALLLGGRSEFVPFVPITALLAWMYTSGAKPYGHRGLGEVGIFMAYGLGACLGPMIVLRVPIQPTAMILVVGVGSFAVSTMVAQNQRDMVTDSAVGKQTISSIAGSRVTSRILIGATALGSGSLVVSVLLSRGLWHSVMLLVLMSLLLLTARGAWSRPGSADWKRITNALYRLTPIVLAATSLLLALSQR